MNQDELENRIYYLETVFEDIPNNEKELAKSLKNEIESLKEKYENRNR